MIVELSVAALRDLRSYAMHVRVVTSAEAALREHARVVASLQAFAEASADGTPATLRGWPRPVRHHFVHPFHVFYERRPGGLFIVRLHHHARRPMSR